MLQFKRKTSIQEDIGRKTRESVCPLNPTPDYARVHNAQVLGPRCGILTALSSFNHREWCRFPTWECFTSPFRKVRRRVRQRGGRRRNVGASANPIDSHNTNLRRKQGASPHLIPPNFDTHGVQLHGGEVSNSCVVGTPVAVGFASQHDSAVLCRGYGLQRVQLTRPILPSTCRNISKKRNNGQQRLASASKPACCVDRFSEVTCEVTCLSAKKRKGHGPEIHGFHVHPPLKPKEPRRTPMAYLPALRIIPDTATSRCRRMNRV